MIEIFFRQHRTRRALYAALLLASAMSTLLIAAHVIDTGRLAYAFLIYNLALAWIPLAFAAAAVSFDACRSRTARLLAAVCCGGWLIFFPNAPYLVTDLVHLRVRGNPLFWLDITALQALAWTGLALGFVSLDLIQRLVARRVGRTMSWLFAAAVLAASAFGIYLGRFRRWNSWDVLRAPRALLRDVAGTLLHPSPHHQVVAHCLVLAAFLFTAYVVLRTWRAGTDPD
jgi:uncharacterized membrane protein